MPDERPVVVVTGMDTTADAVIDRLNAHGVPVARFDLADIAGPLELSARWNAGRLEGTLDTGSRVVDLRQVRSLYYRRPTLPAYPTMSPDDRTFAVEHVRRGVEGVLGSLPGCLYVNHPRRQAVAEYKPAQLEVAASLGFAVPPTLITTRAEDVREFGKMLGPIVYKSLAWTVGTTSREAYAVWTEQVDPADIDDSISLCPHLFQAQVDKIADARVTMVGDQTFCARIESPLLDWRQDYSRIHRYEPITPPAGLVDQMRAYLDRWDLVYGCFDFGIDRDGAWWFFECNPSGEWGWIEHETGLPIAAAFALELEKGRR